MAEEERREGAHRDGVGKGEEELIDLRKRMRRGDRRGFKNPISDDGLSLLMRGR